MSARFEELDWRPTPLGTISLRRRREPVTGEDVYEVKLDDDFLMSSLFTVAEVEVARLALAQVSGEALDVVVGGLGLGYTALTVLEDARVRSVEVIDAIGEVIEWHERELLPVGAALNADPRCTFVLADFFAEFGPDGSQRRHHAVIVDIDHSPRHLLHPSHAEFYEPAGVRRVAQRLHPGGVYSLWSNDPPDDAYTAVLEDVFDHVAVEVVRFDNPLQERESTNTVYVARTRSS